MLKCALLGFLTYESKTGYELKQTMDKSTGHFWHAKQSQIYMTLKKLEEDGLITSHSEHQATRPDRRVYTISESGEKTLREWLSQPVTTLDTTKQLLLLKLFFSGKLEKETILTQLRLLRNLHEQQVELYKTESPDFIKEITTFQPELKQDAHLWEATRRFGELYENMYIRWLDETIAMVEDKI
ncbi:MAG: PadR family transcriptional regulator [Deltaproteobacteria bacterium]|nr:MAG: PadR family transcriptional regulator [Deltaproteobacteria bacterium]RLC15304.1 MAG: PadR family transcriptional regulator [Deltaproteobacteria bacterium]